MPRLQLVHTSIVKPCRISLQILSLQTVKVYYSVRSEILITYCKASLSALASPLRVLGNEGMIYVTNR